MGYQGLNQGERLQAYVDRIQFEWVVLAITFLSFLYLLVHTQDYSTRARLVPNLIIATILLLTIGRLAELWLGTDLTAKESVDTSEISMQTQEVEIDTSTEIRVLGWLLAFGIMLYVIGMLPTTVVFTLVYLAVESDLTPAQIVGTTIGVSIAIYLIFIELLNVRPFTGILF